MEVTYNKTILRRYWDLLSGDGWEKNSNITEVIAVCFGPDGVYIGKALEPWGEYRTELSVEYITPTGYHRMIERTVERRLYRISGAALTNMWGRMITAAKKWPARKPK